MAREIVIPKRDIVIQPEITSEIENVVIHTVSDDGGCVMAQISYNKGSQTLMLWDENTTPTYTQIGVWKDTDVDARISQLLV